MPCDRSVLKIHRYVFSELLYFPEKSRWSFLWSRFEWLFRFKIEQRTNEFFSSIEDDLSKTEYFFSQKLVGERASMLKGTNDRVPIKWYATRSFVECLTDFNLVVQELLVYKGFYWEISLLHLIFIVVRDRLKSKPYDDRRYRYPNGGVPSRRLIQSEIE